jgi:ketosteroid isomerase-like protein
MSSQEGAPQVGPADAEGVIEQLHVAMGAFILGNPRPAVDLFARGEDVTLGNPFGPFARGWDRVVEAATQAATHYRDGEVVGFERVATYASADLACFVEVERYRAKMGGHDEMSSIALRVSTVVRREGDGWRIASRHADPITAARPPESVIAER